MNITRDEALAALRDIERTQTRTRTARSYWFGAPHLFMWGAIWVVGYTCSGLLPGRINGPLWMVLTIAGAIGSYVFGSKRVRAAAAAGAEPGVGRNGRHWYVSLIAVWLFVGATYAVMRPTTHAQYLEFPALIVSLIYSLVGVWGQPRYLLIGGAIFVLSLVGFFFLPAILPYWLAVVGGGGLILGGLWLRQP